jgi:hypothetical protein
VKSGVDVMITIFCDFWQFSAKKLAFFSKTNVMIKILHNLALFRVKHENFFAEFFGENIFKNHNIFHFKALPNIPKLGGGIDHLATLRAIATKSILTDTKHNGRVSKSQSVIHVFNKTTLGAKIFPA